MKKTVDLREIASTLALDFPAISSLWLFGSRRYRTRSLRSDIDLLVVASDYIKAGDLRTAIRKHCPALDLFLATHGRAVSCMNESFVEAESFEALRAKLDAICIWSTDPKQIDTTAPFEQAFRSDVSYVPTAMDGGYPSIGNWGPAVDDYFKEVTAARLPVKPFIADTPTAIAEFLVTVTSAIVTACESMEARKTKALWKPSLESEYDFQDAFYLAMKPWLPDLTREETLLHFDGQEKIADFALLEGRVAIEMKYVCDTNTKAAVVKTLDGLTRFYGRNPRVEALLFLVAATGNADVDAAKWEREFSSYSESQTILTRVYRLR